MSEKSKTMEIPIILQEAMDTGLISEDVLECLKADKLIVQEKIRDLKRLYRERIISHVQLEMAIAGIQKEMQEKILALKFNNT